METGSSQVHCQGIDPGLCVRSLVPSISRAIVGQQQTYKRPSGSHLLDRRQIVENRDTRLIKYNLNAWNIEISCCSVKWKFAAPVVNHGQVAARPAAGPKRVARLEKFAESAVSGAETRPTPELIPVIKSPQLCREMSSPWFCVKRGGAVRGSPVGRYKRNELSTIKIMVWGKSFDMHTLTTPRNHL